MYPDDYNNDYSIKPVAGTYNVASEAFRSFCIFSVRLNVGFAAVLEDRITGDSVLVCPLFLELREVENRNVRI